MYHVAVWYRDGRQAYYTCRDVYFSKEQLNGRPACMTLVFHRMWFLTFNWVLTPLSVESLQISDATGKLLCELSWLDPAINSSEQQEQQNGGKRGTEDTPRPKG